MLLPLRDYAKCRKGQTTCKSKAYWSFHIFLSLQTTDASTILMHRFVHCLLLFNLLTSFFLRFSTPYFLTHLLCLYIFATGSFFTVYSLSISPNHIITLSVVNHFCSPPTLIQQLFILNLSSS